MPFSTRNEMEFNVLVMDQSSIRANKMVRPSGQTVRWSYDEIIVRKLTFWTKVLAEGPSGFSEGFPNCDLRHSWSSSDWIVGVVSTIHLLDNLVDFVKMQRICFSTSSFSMTRNSTFLRFWQDDFFRFFLKFSNWKVSFGYQVFLRNWNFQSLS